MEEHGRGGVAGRVETMECSGGGVELGRDCRGAANDGGEGEPGGVRGMDETRGDEEDRATAHARHHTIAGPGSEAARP
jgi:hypothetical protein